MDNFPDKAVHINFYCDLEVPTGWKNVFIVTLNGYGVIGFCENWDGK